MTSPSPTPSALDRPDPSPPPHLPPRPQVTGGDRVLCVDSDQDVQFDEEFFKYLCAEYGARLRERVFFFVDNRNVIGKRPLPSPSQYRRGNVRPFLF